MFGVGDGRVCGKNPCPTFTIRSPTYLPRHFFWWIIDPVSSSLDGGVIRYNT